jgi:hypothetical protein
MSMAAGHYAPRTAGLADMTTTYRTTGKDIAFTPHHPNAVEEDNVRRHLCIQYHFHWPKGPLAPEDLPATNDTLARMPKHNYDDFVRALTIRQPWIELILKGRKPYEIRSWRTLHRGQILLHAGKSVDKLAAEKLEIPVASLFRGGFVARAELKDCRKFTRADAEMLCRRGAFVGRWAPGLFAWELAKIVTLPVPIEFRGRLGLFNVPSRIVRRVQRDLM